MSRIDCPSEAELTAFNLGDLPESAVEAVATHVESCPRCEQILHRLDGLSDGVISSLRSLSGIGVGTQRSGQPPKLPPWVGDYEILEVLGRGGMGVVYKARHVQLRRLAALKMLLAGEFAHEDYRGRFRAEAEAVARLQHPNIVQIFEVGEWRGAAGPPVPYFALEFVEGGCLSDRLDDKPWPPAQAALWLVTLARAVHYAHGQGIVHRDLKPSNVLLTADNQLKLCDFGVAKRLTGSDFKTLSGLLVGTPEYMAPEQTGGQAGDVGPAADTYALGAILYTALTGRPPFRSAAVLETLAQVRTQEPIRPSRLEPAVPRDLETICLKCLHKDPRRRYASAAALAEDLERFLSGRTIRAKPAGVTERGWKWARRRPAVALLSAAVVGIAALGFALVFWQWQRAETKAGAETVAKEEAQRARQAAVEQQAQLALNQGLALCDQGEVGRGLLWLVRSLELTEKAKLPTLDRAIRVNLADWRGQLNQPQLQMRHSAEVLDLAFSPDGGTLVSVGKDWNVRTWNTDTGEESGPPMILDRKRSGNRWVGRVAFRPGGGHSLVTVDDNGRAIFWDVERRRREGTPLRHPLNHAIWGAAFSPDGKELFTCCDDGAARRWDVAKRELIGPPLWHNRELVGYYTLALSPDGRKLVTGGKDRRAVLWDVATGTPDGLPLLHDSTVQAITFSRDGRKIITGTEDGRLRVWQPQTGQMVDMPPQGTAVTSLAVTPDGQTLATGTAGGVVRLWDMTTLRPIGQTHQIILPVLALTFHPDGQTLALGLVDGTIQLLKIPRPKAIGLPLSMPGPVQRVAFHPDGTRLLAGSGGGAQWWESGSGRTWGRSMDNERYEPGGVVPSLDGRTYAKLNATEATALSPDGRTLAVARWTGVEGQPRGRAEILDAVTGERLRQTPEQPFPLRGVAYSPNAKRLLTWDHRPGNALLWNVATLRDPKPVFQSLRVSIHQAVFTSAETVLLACGDGTARRWNVARDEEIDPEHRPHHGYPIMAVAVDPHGSRMATGCQAGTVRLWDGTRGALEHDVRGNAGEITAFAFSPDGLTLLTASYDGTARFWDVESGRQLGAPLRHTDAVLCVAFDPEGQTVATGTKDGRVRRWRVPAQPELGDLQHIHQWIREETRLRLDEQGMVYTLSGEELNKEAKASRTVFGERENGS